jgi:hypothetical protein
VEALRQRARDLEDEKVSASANALLSSQTARDANRKSLEFIQASQGRFVIIRRLVSVVVRAWLHVRIQCYSSAYRMLGAWWCNVLTDKCIARDCIYRVAVGGACWPLGAAMCFP